MPIPNYGYNNSEKKTHQDIKFEMAPEYVSDDNEEPIIIHGQKIKKKRGKVVTGKIGIDLERTLVINNETNPDVWKTNIDQSQIEEAKKYSSQGHKNLKADVRRTLDSLISASKANSIKQSEESVTGVSIQPSGTYRLGSQPRNSLSPAKIVPKTPDNIAHRVDSRYDSRQSLSQAHYAKNIVTNGSEDYSYSQVSMKSFSAHGIRGLN